MLLSVESLSVVIVTLGIVVAVAIIEGARVALAGTVVKADADTVFADTVLEASTTAEAVAAEETGTAGDTVVEAVNAEEATGA